MKKSGCDLSANRGRFFQGQAGIHPKSKKITTKPLLRKDFIFDEYQIYESRANEADAILLIAVRYSVKIRLKNIFISQENSDCPCFFEVHDLKELETALSVNADIIGINNRDLKTLKIDLNNTFIIKKKYHPIKSSSAKAESKPAMTYCALNQQALTPFSSEHHLWRQRI